MSKPMKKIRMDESDILNITDEQDPDLSHIQIKIELNDGELPEHESLSEEKPCIPNFSWMLSQNQRPVKQEFQPEEQDEQFEIEKGLSSPSSTIAVETEQTCNLEGKQNEEACPNHTKATIALKDNFSEHSRQVSRDGVNGTSRSRKSNSTKQADVEFYCSVCNEGFSSTSLFATHIVSQNHIGVVNGKGSRIRCPICHKYYTSKGILKAHLFTHSGERPYQCFTCEKSFNSPGTLRKHSLIHTGERPYKCPVCGKDYRYQSHLKRHEIVHETGMKTHGKFGDTTKTENRYKCSQCEKSFTDKNKLKNHAKWHLDERPYLCHVCKKGFVHSSHVRRHMRIHTGERQFNCGQCSKTFVTSNDLKNHERIHLGVYPYKCTLCGKSFRVNSNLCKHIKVHFRKGDLHRMPELSQNNVNVETTNNGIVLGKLSNGNNRLIQQRILKLHKFKCSLCCKSYKSQICLFLHCLISHTSFLRCYKCTLCNKNYFTKRIALAYHFLCHVKGRNFPCSLCDKEFDEKHSLRVHSIMSHYSEVNGINLKAHSSLFNSTKQRDVISHGSITFRKKVHICQICNKTYSTKASLKIHMQKHMGKDKEVGYTCSICFEFFSDRGSLFAHNLTHEKQKKFSCRVCDKRFSQRRHLSNHELRHSMKRSFSCTICKAVFAQPSGLHHHIKFIHNGVKDYKCSICSKYFMNSSHLQRHLVVHTGEKPFRCSLCDKAFTDGYYMQVHMRKHTGENPYCCSVCNKPFYTTNTLRRHMLTHDASSKDSFKCDLCSKVFAFQYNFDRHMKVHRGDRPFICSYCSKSFVEKGDLKRHMRIHSQASVL